MDLRAQLEELARKLHLVEDDHARDLGEHVQRSIDEDDHEGLRDKVNEAAVHFDTAHPELAGALRRIVDALNASGM
ncbi:MAG: DUF4404 family protein [Acidimicrobiales bacterium]